MQGLAGRSASASSEGVRKLRDPQGRIGLEEQGCVSGLKAVGPQVQFDVTPRILNFS